MTKLLYIMNWFQMRKMKRVTWRTFHSYVMQAYFCLPKLQRLNSPQVFLVHQGIEMQSRRPVKDLSQANSKKSVSQISYSSNFLWSEGEMHKLQEGIPNEWAFVLILFTCALLVLIVIQTQRGRPLKKATLYIVKSMLYHLIILCNCRILKL